MRDREVEVAEAHRKTLEWIFADEDSKKVGSDFLQCLKDDNEGIYWINSKAGSGKSTLMRFIHDHMILVEQLRIWAGERPLTMAGFFFWTSGSYEQRSQVGLLRYLLFQLLQQRRSFIPIRSSLSGIVETVLGCFNARKNKGHYALVTSIIGGGSETVP
jgi:hypothetical protein